MLDHRTGATFSFLADKAWKGAVCGPSPEQFIMPGTDDTLVVARLRVRDDVANRSFTISLEDVVKMMMDDPDHPARERPLIVSLLNEEILARYPHAAEANRGTLEVTIAEFSEIKTQVARKLLLRSNDSGPLPT